MKKNVLGTTPRNKLVTSFRWADRGITVRSNPSFDREADRLVVALGWGSSGLEDTQHKLQLETVPERVPELERLLRETGYKFKTWDKPTMTSLDTDFTSPAFHDIEIQIVELDFEDDKAIKNFLIWLERGDHVARIDRNIKLYKMFGISPSKPELIAEPQQALS